MYLCGFTLFLSLILNRTYTLILDVLRFEEKVKKYESISNLGAKDNNNGVNDAEVTKLRRALAEKERDLETMKKQSEGLGREYSKLSDQYSEREKDPTPKKDR